MTKTILATTTALGLLWAAPGLSQAQLPALLEGMEAMAGAMGNTLEYADKTVGSDYSVEYTDLRMINSGDRGSEIALDWLRVVPSADVPGQITVSLPPHASVTLSDPDFAEPYQIDILSDGITATLDNIIPGAGGEAAETWNYLINIPSLHVVGIGNNPIVKELSFSTTAFTTAASFTPATQTVTIEGGLEALIYAFDLTTPDGPVAQSGNVVQMVYDLAFDAIDESQMMDYMTGARAAHINYSATSANSAARMQNADITLDMTSQSIQSMFGMAITDGIFSMTGTSGVSNIQVNAMVLDGAPVPPFTIALTGAEIGARVPLANTGAVEEANIRMALHDLMVPENLISMIDPGQSIPRSPINLNIDVLANVISNIDWSNPSSAFDSGNPADIAAVQDITIRQILLAAGGAEVTAIGQADIDNSMGFPFPTGMITVSAMGVQSLVGTLVQLGLVPQQEAGMMMGMMMSFARSEGADHFVSDIEFSPEGVTANGTPLPF